MHKGMAPLALLASVVAVITITIATPARAVTVVENAQITTEETVGSFRVTYSGTAVYRSPVPRPVTPGPDLPGAMWGACTVLTHPSSTGATRPDSTNEECWLENVETAAVYPLETWGSRSTLHANHEGQYPLISTMRLKLCMRAELMDTFGHVTTGPTRCAPLT